MEASFHERVLAIVAHVPMGRVTTYGRIARAVGAPRAARGVGRALNMSVGENPTAMPCHRVVNREGRLSGARHFPTPTAMAERLRAEGVAFLAPDRVDLEAHLWEPPELREPPRRARRG